MNDDVRKGLLIALTGTLKTLGWICLIYGVLFLILKFADK